MAEIDPRAAGPFLAEWPTAAARLIITLGPAQLAGGAISGEAHHLITTIGIMGSVWSGIAALVVTVHVASAHIALAFAELTLALMAAVLIAISGHIPARTRRR
jgi:hypothetical protein